MKQLRNPIAKFIKQRILTWIYLFKVEFQKKPEKYFRDFKKNMFTWNITNCYVVVKNENLNTRILAKEHEEIWNNNSKHWLAQERTSPHYLAVRRAQNLNLL